MRRETLKREQRRDVARRSRMTDGTTSANSLQIGYREKPLIADNSGSPLISSEDKCYREGGRERTCKWTVVPPKGRNA